LQEAYGTILGHILSPNGSAPKGIVARMLLRLGANIAQIESFSGILRGGVTNPSAPGPIWTPRQTLGRARGLVIGKAIC